MKTTTYILSALAALALVSCDADRDDNPVLSVPAGDQALTLLKPEAGSNVIDLAQSKTIRFVLESPANYGFPTEVLYGLEVSANGNFNDPASYIALDTRSNTTTIEANIVELDFAVNKLLDTQSADDPLLAMPHEIYVRANAVPKSLTAKEYQIHSNAQKITVLPYFLKESLPEIWYLTGGIIADGSWANDPAKIGTGMLPMYIKPGQAYNQFSGKGQIEYVGYFPEGDFKNIAVKGLVNWNYGFCGGDLASGGFSYRDGGDDPGNIHVSQAGYYRITIDTEQITMKSEAIEAPAGTYATATIAGQPMAPMTTVAGGINHDWFATVTLNDAPATFQLDGKDFSTDAFPYGIATEGGAAMTTAAGTYNVYLNDITGAYMFIEVK